MEAWNPYAPPDPSADDRWMADQSRELQILASRGTRFGAQVLDSLLSFGCALPFIIAAAALGFSGGLDSELIIIAIIALAVMAVLGLAIYQWYLVATTGQSLGKKWLGIKIVRMDGSDVDFMSGVVLRSWVIGFIGAVPYIGACVSLLDALWIFGEEQRCLHDHIAGTKVIVKSLSMVD